MSWIEPSFSKEKVKKAGDILIAKEIDFSGDEYYDASLILHNWRSSHAFPMQIMLDFLRKNAIKIDQKSIAVQRLKRVVSIYNKLEREKGMSLSRMEDIAGCRVVLKSSKEVYRLYKKLKNSKTKNKLHRERDYINEPKESGYRGIHLVYKYNGSKTKFNGLPVEIQLRSKIQHSWATAVEVVDTFTRQNIKSSIGDDIWLDFFKFASAEFSRLEGCHVDERFNEIDTYAKLKDCVERLSLIDKLKAFNVVANKLTKEESKAYYFLLLLDFEKRIVNIRRFAKNKLPEASTTYDNDEKLYRDDSNKDIVLVSALSLNALKKAYPNYFLDTDEFRKYLDMVLRKQI